MQRRTSCQQLQHEEGMTIASMRQQGSSVRAMARTLGRSAATVSRELARNTCPTVGYASAPAQARCTSRREAAHPTCQAACAKRRLARGAHAAGVEVVAPTNLGYAQAHVARATRR